MPKPYSMDIRTRVIKKHQEGKTVKEITNELAVKATFVYDTLSLYKATGSVEPKPASGGRKAYLDNEKQQQIAALIQETPDLTLQEIKDELSLEISISVLCDTINKKLNLNHKKTLFDTGQNDAEVQGAREQWTNDQKEMDTSSIVFLDETGINIGMTRLYGRAFGEERFIDYVPDVRFDRISLLSSIRLDGTLVPLTYKGTLDGKLFLAYVIQLLVPTLKEGDIVIMDNASPHKVKGVVEAIEAAGAFVIYQPTYSPDFNPAENMWSKIKAALRKAKTRTIDALYEALRDALNSISISDIKGWFGEIGYSV